MAGGTCRMILDWLSKPIVWAAGMSFCLGAFLYVLVRRIIVPVLRYRILKQRIRRALDSPDDLATTERKALLRRYADALTTCYAKEIPLWYRLALKNHDEAPLEAARHLMTIANVSSPRHVDRRSIEVRRALRLSVDGENR